jgi:hypothetical protein
MWKKFYTNLGLILLAVLGLGVWTSNVQDFLSARRMETIDERALTNQAPLPNQIDCGGRLEARPISQPRCQRTAAEGIRFSHSLIVISVR